MNNFYYKNLDENFINALNFYETKYSHEELIELLKNGNIPQKQIAALKLDSINSTEDAYILLSNLTGQDGKIREAVSLRLSEFMSDNNYIKYFNLPEYSQIFLDAIIDINGNICRNVIQAVANLKDNPDFYNIFCPKLTKLTFDLLDIVEKFNFQDGKYKVNKEAFKLYWCLEAIYVFWDKLKTDELKKIITRSSDIAEYTIREKAAKILTRNIQDNDLSVIKEKLKKDSNYYVRRF